MKISLILVLLYASITRGAEFNPECLEVYRNQIKDLEKLSTASLSLTVSSAALVLGTYYFNRPYQNKNKIIYTSAGVAAISGLANIWIEQKRINHLITFFLILESIPELEKNHLHQNLLYFIQKKFYRDRHEIWTLLTKNIIKQLNKKQKKLGFNHFINSSDLKQSIRNLYLENQLCKLKKKKVKTIGRRAFEKIILQKLNQPTI